MSGAWAADALRGTLLEVGGVTHSGCCAATTYDGVWTFDERGWTQLDPTLAHPSKRGGHGMAFDSGHGRIALFGGAEEVRSNVLPVKGDLWEWDGSRWEQRCDDAPASDHCTTTPPGRRFFAMAYDPVGARVVLFGGETETGAPYGDTWAWNGVDWRSITTTPAPSARSRVAMAFHGGTNSLVLYGGTTGGAETWLLEGDTWTRRHVLRRGVERRVSPWCRASGAPSARGDTRRRTAPLLDGVPGRSYLRHDSRCSRAYPALIPKPARTFVSTRPAAGLRSRIAPCRTCACRASPSPSTAASPCSRTSTLTSAPAGPVSSGPTARARPRSSR